MTNKYILTGGPGSGKSSILLELELRGEYTIREAAEDVIRRSQADGIEMPWERPDFQERILQLQIQREKAIPKGIERAFIDRGIPDGLAYAQDGTKTYWQIGAAIPIYDGVFLIENLGQTATNKVRRENQEEALKLERKFGSIYEALGYKVQRIPAGSVKERAKAILTLIDLGAKYFGTELR